jgi:hypothetical protein
MGKKVSKKCKKRLQQGEESGEKLQNIQSHRCRQVFETRQKEKVKTETETEGKHGFETGCIR